MPRFEVEWHGSLGRGLLNLLPTTQSIRKWKCSPPLACYPIVPPVFAVSPVTFLLHWHRRCLMPPPVGCLYVSQQDVAGWHRGAYEAYGELRDPMHVSGRQCLRSAEELPQDSHCYVQVDKARSNIIRHQVCGQKVHPKGSDPQRYASCAKYRGYFEPFS